MRIKIFLNSNLLFKKISYDFLKSKKISNINPFFQNERKNDFSEFFYFFFVLKKRNILIER
jgi:hypothetical protein